MVPCNCILILRNMYYQNGKRLDIVTSSNYSRQVAKLKINAVWSLGHAILLLLEMLTAI